MIRIAVCDDDPKVLDRLCQYIENMAGVGSYDIVCERFTDGFALLDKQDSGVRYDLVFLDIVMPNIDGMQVGKEIYEVSRDTKIVYLTSSPEYAVDSYDVGALDYLMKPLTDEKFKRCMTRFFERFNAPKAEEVLIQEKGKITRFPLNTLLYVEVLDHDLVYYLVSQDSVMTRQSLSEAEAMLIHRPNFIKPHRSYIVNLDFVSKISSKALIMVDNSEVPIARGKSKTVSDQYLFYKLSGGGKK